MELIRTEMHGHVALVTMDHPPVNSQNQQLQDELVLTMDRLSDTAEARAIVLTGKGRVFSAGADMKSRGPMTEPGKLLAHSRRTRECFYSILECRKPVIGAINGPALGAGLAVAASCDILFASNNASFGLPEIDVGLLGGGRHAMRLFGQSLTRRMMFTGYRVPADELYRLGVIEACLPPEELLPRAMAMAESIASKSPLAIGMAKHALNSIEEMSLRDGYRFEQDMTMNLSKSDDAREAQKAFLEKRTPVYSGR